MNYCRECTTHILSEWRGWPLRTPVPLLPQVKNGVCMVCGAHGEAISKTEIQWLNYHGPYNTGLPDYWLLVTNQKTVWGLPYHSEATCPRCGKRAVLSEHGDSRRNHYEYKLGCPSCYEEESLRQREEFIKRREEEAKHRQQRENYFRSLAALPFENRVTAIVEDKSIDPYSNLGEWIEWKSEWSRCSDEEVAALNAESIQRLIDLCEGNLVVRFSEVLTRLYDRRHQLRQEAMDEIRRKYSSMSPRDQLTELVVAASTPIAHFPVELAKVVSDDWLDTLPERHRADFLAQIRTCRLRAWVKARERLSLQAR